MKVKSNIKTWNEQKIFCIGEEFLLSQAMFLTLKFHSDNLAVV